MLFQFSRKIENEMIWSKKTNAFLKNFNTNRHFAFCFLNNDDWQFIRSFYSKRNDVFNRKYSVTNSKKRILNRKWNDEKITQISNLCLSCNCDWTWCNVQWYYKIFDILVVFDDKFEKNISSKTWNTKFIWSNFACNS